MLCNYLAIENLERPGEGEVPPIHAYGNSIKDDVKKVVCADKEDEEVVKRKPSVSILEVTKHFNDRTMPDSVQIIELLLYRCNAVTFGVITRASAASDPTGICQRSFGLRIRIRNHLPPPSPLPQDGLPGTAWLRWLLPARWLLLLTGTCSTISTSSSIMTNLD